MSRYTLSSSGLPLPGSVPDASATRHYSLALTRAEMISALPARSTLSRSLVLLTSPSSSSDSEDIPMPPPPKRPLPVSSLLGAVLALLLEKSSPTALDMISEKFPSLAQSELFSSFFDLPPSPPTSPHSSQLPYVTSES